MSSKLLTPALDTLFHGETLQIYTQPKELMKVKDALKKSGVEIENASIVFTPLDPIKIDEHTKIDYENLLEKLEKTQ